MKKDTEFAITYQIDSQTLDKCKGELSSLEDHYKTKSLMDLGLAVMKQHAKEEISYRSWVGDNLLEYDNLPDLISAYNSHYGHLMHPNKNFQYIKVVRYTFRLS